MEVRPDKNYLNDTKSIIEEAKVLLENKDVAGAVEKLDKMEKKTRLANDAISTGLLLSLLVELHGDRELYDELGKLLSLYSKKRGQSKQAATVMVKKACEYVEKLKGDLERELKLIEILRQVTDGKIYVEVERARLTRRLVEIREIEESNIKGAMDVILELQVETYGSMQKYEKTDFLLEQMRLCLSNNDYTRTQIISKKISTRFFKEDGTEDLKLKYYRLMIELHLHDEDYLNIARHYMEVYNTALNKSKTLSKAVEDKAKSTEDGEKADEAKMEGMSEEEIERNKLETLRKAVTYLILASYDNEKSDLMHRYLAIRDLEKLPLCTSLLEAFISMELIMWHEFSSTYQEHLIIDITEDLWQRVLHRRAQEHNVRVIASYYTRISMPRLSQLLELDNDQCESMLSDLVIKGTVHARVDRLDNIVHFTRTKSPEDVLNDWSNNLDQLMAFVNHTDHLINKERMMIHAGAVTTTSSVPPVTAAWI